MLLGLAGRPASTASNPRTSPRSPSRPRPWPGCPWRARTTSPAPLRSGRSARSRTLLDQYLENPVDYIPDAARTASAEDGQ